MTNRSNCAQHEARILRATFGKDERGSVECLARPVRHSSVSQHLQQARHQGRRTGVAGQDGNLAGVRERHHQHPGSSHHPLCTVHSPCNEAFRGLRVVTERGDERQRGARVRAERVVVCALARP